jgi:hypothetical protein
MGTDPPGVGIDASHVAAATLDAIRADHLYVFTYPPADHAGMRDLVQRRADALLAAVDRGAVTG